MIVIKNETEQQRMREAGRVAANVLRDVVEAVQPGRTTLELDEWAAERIQSYGGKSAFLGYRMGRLSFPRHACISVNEEVVHGMGNDRRIQVGDVVSVDIGVIFNGFIGDNARSVLVGGADLRSQKLIDVTREALYKGISQAMPGNRVADISRAIQEWVESNGFAVVREFVGHGVGRSMHEEPQIPNFVATGSRRSARLEPGMTLAIEPMVNLGGAAVRILKDGWTVVTEDGQPSAHFEHSVLITSGEAEILTCPDPTSTE